MRHRLGRAALSNCRGHERSPAMDWTGTAPSRSPGSEAKRISRAVPGAGKNGGATLGTLEHPAKRGDADKPYRLVSYWVGRASNMMRARQMYQKTQYGHPSSCPSPRGRGTKGEGINHRKNSMLAGALFAGGVDARPSVRGVATQRGASLRYQKRSGYPGRHDRPAPAERRTGRGGVTARCDGTRPSTLSAADILAGKNWRAT